VLENFGTEFGEGLESDKSGVYKENPLLTASIFSVWSFGWMTPLMSKGARETISENDMPALLPQNEAERLGDDLTRAMKKQCVPF
jgi:ATP-binding cassette, subfamily C (CFTR/MRP), member 1